MSTCPFCGASVFRISERGAGDAETPDTELDGADSTEVGDLSPPVVPGRATEPTPSPPHVPTPASTASSAGYRSAASLARLLQVLLLLWVLLAAVAAASSLAEYRLVSRVIDSPLRVTIAQLEAADDRQTTIFVIWLIGFIVTGIVFMTWTRRVYTNTESLGAGGLRHSSGWAVGGWVVPIANLWIPKQILDDVWRANDPDLSYPVGTTWSRGRVSPLLHWWWGLWIVGGLVGQYLFRTRDVSDLDGFRRLVAVDAALDIVFVAAAILAFWVVTRLTQRQGARAAEIFTGYEPRATMLASVTDDGWRSGGISDRPAAISGILTVATSAAIISALVVFDASPVEPFPTTASPTATGGEGQGEADPDSGGVLVSDLDVGHCFNDPPGFDPSSTQIQQVLAAQIVPCDLPHDSEVFAQVRHPAEPQDAFPGDSVLASYGATECASPFAEFVGASWFEAGYDISAVFPNQGGWEAGDRAIQCTLIRLDGQKAEGSARASGSIVPESYFSFFRLQEGACFDDTDWVAFASPVSCGDPHDNEVYAVLTIPYEPGDDYSSVDKVLSYAAGACAAEFAKRVDSELAADLDYGPLAFPLPLTWVLGHRTYVCALRAQDLSKLAGSQLAAHTRFGALIGVEFQDQASTVSFPDFASVAGLDLVGSARQANQVLLLTTFAEHAQRGAPFEEERPQRGAVWSSEKVPVEHGFETAFVFQLEIYSWFTIGDGFAFVIQDSDAAALGEDFGYNGIGYNRISNSVAVEFDTVRQTFLSDPGTSVPGAPDLLANHISVQTKGTEPNDAHTRASLGWVDLEHVVMADRAAHVALIRYVPGELTVFVDEFETPALIIDIDLAETLQLDAGSAYVGFTASSGPRITGHKILSWEFASAGPR